jgi:hypothetical protein
VPGVHLLIDGRQGFGSLMSALASASRGLVVNKVNVGKLMFGFNAFPA